MEKTNPYMISWLQEKHPLLVKSMQECSHHSKTTLNPYHLEGDVWSHTLLVLESGKHLPELLRFALLCHDIAKPLCRKENEGRTSFKGHEVYSAFLSLKLSREFGYTKEESLFIFKLIAYHTSILKQIEKENTLPIVLNQHKGHPEMFLDLLSITKADGLGRVMNNKSERLDYIEDYYSGILNTMISEEYRKKDNQLQVTCLMGLPATGKSTYIQKNNIPKELIIERDSIAKKLKIDLSGNIHQRDKDLLLNEINSIKEDLIKNKNDIYIDMVNLIDRDRHLSLKNIPRNYWFKGIILIDELDNIYEKNQKREKKIPKDYYNYILMNSSLPLFDEFDEIDFIFL